MKSIHFFSSFLIVALSFTTLLAAEEENTSGLTFTEYEATEDLVYGHKEGLALTMDVLTPKQGAKGIGLILVSSGSWKSGKSDIKADILRRREKDHWAQGLLQGGYTLFVVRHGSSPRFFVPEMIKDMNRAVRYVRTIAKDYGANPDQLGITSGSSGGHLALMAAMTGDDGNPDAEDPIERVSSRLQCTVAWFPPTDMINWGSENGFNAIKVFRPSLFQRMFGEITDLEQQLREISPLYFTTEQAPPLLLIHGDSDLTVPLQQSEILKAKYEELSLPVKLIVEPGGGHSYWPGIIAEYQEVWNWFDGHLKS